MDNVPCPSGIEDKRDPPIFWSIRVETHDHASLRNHIIRIATAELGIREATGNNDGKRVEEYLAYTSLGKGHAWCAAFVSWCYGQAGLSQPRNPWSPALFPKAKVYWTSTTNVLRQAQTDISYNDVRRRQESTTPLYGKNVAYKDFGIPQKKSLQDPLEPKCLSDAVLGTFAKTNCEAIIHATKKQRLMDNVPCPSGIEDKKILPNDDVRKARQLHINPADLFGIYGKAAKRINHVGLVKKQDSNYLISIEGNSHNRVESRRRHLSTIYALADWVRER